MKNLFKPLAVLAAVLMLAAGSGQAIAAGTASGTSISNTATANYSVGGVAQNPVVSTAATFLVDTKVSMTLAPTAGVNSVTNVVSGATRQVTAFTLTNTGNLVSDFALATANLANGTVYASTPARTDNFDATACAVFADVNGNNTYEAATDTRTYVDELAVDASIRVFNVCDIPLARVNLDFSGETVTATAAAGGTANTQGAALTATAGAKALNTVAIVLADAAGTDDVASDGKISARGGYLVQVASLTTTKTVAAYCDPVTFNSNPKMAPGSYARYSVVIANAAGASASASLGLVTDTLVSQLTFDPNLINAAAASCSTPTSAAGSGVRVSCTGGSRACVGTPIFLTTASTVTGQNISVNLATVLPAEGTYAAGELKAGESVTVLFNALIN